MIRRSLGFSPCPNDTFIFHALVSGDVTVPGIELEARLEDVETLNTIAREGGIDVTKVSFGVIPYILDEYTLLRSGGALGYGCGPLLVAREPISPARLAEARIAIPGRYTTANLLLRLFAPNAAPGIEMPYDRIMPAVAAGEVDAGLIIHESRFTYRDHGLVEVVDLGAWWESATGSPIPLGGIVARRDLGGEVALIEKGIRASVEAAFADPEASVDYVREHARELSDEVTRSHIDLYVNDFSVDMGATGEAAIRALMLRASEAGLVPRVMDPFATPGAI